MGLKDAFIVGAADTKIGKQPDKTAMQLYGEAVRAALADAGLKKEDVDLVYTGLPHSAPVLCFPPVFCEIMGLKPAFCSSMEAGGASPVQMVLTAAAAIAAGQGEVALCVFGDKTATTDPVRGAYAWMRPEEGKQSSGGITTGPTMEFEAPYGTFIATIAFAMLAQRYMSRYNIKPEQMAGPSMSARAFGAINPEAQMHSKGALTHDQYMAGRLISTPLRVMDCSLVSDGAAAVIVTSRGVAEGTRKKPIRVIGGGGETTHWNVSQTPDIQDMAARKSAERAYKSTGLGPKDIQVFNPYDCFSITVMLQLELMGFCGEGEGAAYAMSGAIGLGGKIPVNPHGGMLAHGHLAGMNHVTEMVKQLRGECGPRQVKDAKIGMVTGNGGYMSDHTTMLLGGD